MFEEKRELTAAQNLLIKTKYKRCIRITIEIKQRTLATVRTMEFEQGRICTSNQDVREGTLGGGI